MNVEVIEPDVHRVRGEAYDSAATVYVSGGDAVLVDGLASRADAEALKDLVEKGLGAQVRFILVTHYFSDHIAALGLFPEAQVVAHRAYRQTFDGERHRSDEERGFYRRPSLLVDGGIVLHWGRFTFDAFHNPGHTMSTLAVEVPEADVLHVGDTAVGHMAYFAYTSPDLLAEGLRSLSRRRRRRILASHGGVVDPGVLESALHYLDSLGRRTREARRSPRPDEAIRAIPLAECLPPGIVPTDFEEVFHQRNLADVVERHLYGPA